jgi:hypothetical protein
MSINKKIIVAAIAGLALGASSCRKYLDVNNNPNVAHNVTVTTLLPAAELYAGSAMGADLQINGSIWAQFWTQSPEGKEYVQIDQLNPPAEAYSMGWQNLYAGAENFYQLAKLADQQYKSQYKAIALLMQAYTFQAITDGWGDVPFTEALQGQYPDGHIVNPKYDSQRVVYRGIIKYIDSALTLINVSDAAAPGSDDLIYGGNMAKWKKFANTLKLRALMRMADVDPLYAKSRIDTLFRTNAQFLAEGDDAKITYGSAAGNNNPLYSELRANELGGIQQLAGSKTCIDSMVANNDYRGLVFYNAVPGMGLVGINQSEYDVKLPSGSFSIPGVYTGADISGSMSAVAPVVLLSSWESYFLQAEAFARGFATGNEGQAFYAGIHASFAFYNTALINEASTTGDAAYNIYVNGDIPSGIPAARWSVYPGAGTVAQKVEFILTQKWFAMCGNQGFEAWTEWRRTGFPSFLVNPKNSHLGGKAPLRFVYPATERANNSKYPGEIPVTTNVWWDVL